MNVKLVVGSLVCSAILGTTGAASANEVAASAGFTVDTKGNVTSAIFSAALSSQNAATFAASDGSSISTFAVSSTNPLAALAEVTQFHSESSGGGLSAATINIGPVQQPTSTAH
jgi:hypothetical protein